MWFSEPGRLTFAKNQQCVCVYSNSRNDVPRVAQRYGTIAAHIRRRASVLVVFAVFCVHMYSFAGLIRRTSPPTFSDTAITDRHSDTTISSSELTGCGYPGLLDRKNHSDMCPRWESNPRLPACKASTLSTRPGSPLKNQQMGPTSLYISCLNTTVAWPLTPCLKTTNQRRTCHFYVIFE